MYSGWFLTNQRKIEVRKSNYMLDGMISPETRARVAERSRIIEIIAKQMGCSRRDAADHLFCFEAVTTSEGQVLN
jgi:hypothetical protein